MPGSTISITFAVNGKETILDLTKGVDGIRKAMEATVTEADQLQKKVIKWNAITNSIQAAKGAIGQLQGVMVNLSSAYDTQIEAESLLANNMRNTMGATEDEIRSIKELCSAQQELGVIGDEVQLTGAQELATYLGLKSSLEQLIPVMNDMVAQQYGLNATGEQAAQIASMLGKVMNGQTGALSRYGYSFDEIQEYILKYGSEAEKAAILTEVVSEAVGGANEALRETASGGFKSFENRIGDMKEKLGEMAKAFRGPLSMISQLIMTSAGIAQLATSFKTMGSAVNFSTLKLKALSIQGNIAAASHRMQSIAAKALGVSELTAATATGVLKTQIIALQTAMTLGLSVAITGVVTLLTKLLSKSEDANRSMERTEDILDGIANPAEAYKLKLSETSKELAGYSVKLESLIKQKKEDKGLIDELNAKYGESFGVYSTQAEWYDVLKTKAKEYIEIRALEARANALYARREELKRKADELDARARSMREDGSAYERKGPLGLLGWKVSGDFQTLQSNIATVKEEGVKAVEEYDAAIAELSAKASDMAGAVQSSTSSVLASASTLSTKVEDLAGDIQEYRVSVAQALDINYQLGQGQNAIELRLKTMESGITSLIRKYGTENEEVKALIEEYRKLKSARDLADEALPKLDKFGQKESGIIPQKDIGTIKEIPDIAGAAQQSLGALSSTFSSLGKIVGESAAAWLDWASNLISAISQAIPQIVALTAAQKGKANADAEGAVAGGMSAVANIPYVGPALAVAAAASIVAALAAIPKFAKGGIAYGPTLGMLGEYAGASNNPEVVAPLDKLRSMIQPASYDFGDVRFRIEGRDLVGVLGKHSSLVSRT